MNQKINQLFVNEVNKIIKETGMTKTHLAKSIGYNIYSMDKVLKDNVVTVVQFDNLVKFCEIYNYDIDFFIKHEKYIEQQKRQNEENEEIGFNLNDIQIHLEEIKTSFDAIEKANEKIKELFSSGVKFSEQQIKTLKSLRNTMGI